MILLLSMLTAISAQKDCSLDILSTNPEPLIISSETDTFLTPSPGHFLIYLRYSQKIKLACPGSQFKNFKLSEFEASCLKNEKLSTYFGTIDFRKASCKETVANTAIEQCQKINIGYDLSSFLPLFSVCFDRSKQTPLYSHNTILKSIGSRQRHVIRPLFIQDSFYNLKKVCITDLYSHQMAIINDQLGLKPESRKYINVNFLTKGHLTPMTDFFYATQQIATFHYINTVPQWSAFNEMNWNYIEEDVRNLANLRRLNLEIYTGAYGITTLPHDVTKKDIPLYLFRGDSPALPIPELLWKIVYDPESKLGIVILGVNNPYQRNAEKSVICTDISSKISWLHYRKDDLLAGYIYVCEINDFRKKVQFAPKFTVLNILK